MQLTREMKQQVCKHEKCQWQKEGKGDTQGLAIDAKEASTIGAHTVLYQTGTASKTGDPDKLAKSCNNMQVRKLKTSYHNMRQYANNETDQI